MKLLLVLVGLWGLLFGQADPKPVVHAVLFYSPGCSFCEAVINKVLPPLEAQYGDQLQIQFVTLAGVDDVNTLFDSAAALGLQRNQVVVPLLVVGSQALAGQAAIEKQLPAIIAQGLAQGGIPAPQLPPALAELAARLTPTPRPTMVTFGGVPPAPGVTPSAVGGGSTGCTNGGKSSCNLSPSQLTTSTAPSSETGLTSDPMAVAIAAGAGVLVLAALAWFVISRRQTH